MPAATVRDLSLVLDTIQGRYTATLCEGWPEEGRRSIVQPLDGSLFDQLPKLTKASSDEHFGEVLFDWILAPESEIRRGVMESQLEQMLAGKVAALSHPGAFDDGLPLEERPRLVILFCCEAAAAAPVLLQSGVPAVLAMRRQIPDSDGTEAMVKPCADVLTDESKSIEEVMADLRRFLKKKEPQFADERLHFSVPVLHLAPPTTMAANRKRQ